MSSKKLVLVWNRVIIQYLPVELGDEVAGPPGNDGWCQVADECPGAIS